ncbi:fimbrial protein [Serratia marcescens]|nr:fimbrial protein [Serratia marcescens]PHY73845.1 exotoxin [Serratia marcescens]PIC11210.1 exotoxin [Serratia marcescens]HAT2878025.1 fimbrial protein [Serratia marcescens]HAT2889348.1 fimbrial protein [Serratia marcescens]HAT2894913.1 fimbrial protein [Serratia marcescens]
MDNHSMRFRNLSRVVLAALSVTLPVKAVTTVTIKVTVLAPLSCVINDNKPIEVNFGEILTTRIDGINYRQQVRYTLNCPGAGSNAMKLQVHGTGASFDSTVLGTNKNGLGIALLLDDNKVAINNWLNFTYPTLPELWAVPVMQPDAILTGGKFSAGATMKVDYQ